MPLDGSEHSQHALSYSLDIADKYDASIILVTVHQPTYIVMNLDPSLSLKLSKEISDSHKAQHKHILAKSLKYVKKINPKLRVSTRLIEGRPADQIIKTAEEEHIDLIIIGSRGLGGIQQFLLGSVSDRVADQAPCPVLIIR